MSTIKKNNYKICIFQRSSYRRFLNKCGYFPKIRELFISLLNKFKVIKIKSLEIKSADLFFREKELIDNLDSENKFYQDAIAEID